MKVKLTGWNGFLSTKLRENNSIEWVEDGPCDILFLMGGPTFTESELGQHDAQVMHQYVRETIKIIDRFPGHIIFASSTGVDDIRLDHKGSTCYNLAKLYLENYLINNTDRYTILRIGTIISNSLDDIARMKSDRIQPQIQNGIFPSEWEDYYLDIDQFVNTTIDVILGETYGIVEYPLIKLTTAQLTKMSKK
jgi:nucleoside-diphosphate-sugar epimerase